MVPILAPVDVLGPGVRPLGNDGPVPGDAAAHVPARIQGIPVPEPELQVGTAHGGRRAFPERAVQRAVLAAMGCSVRPERDLLSWNVRIY